jgi:hypothetical protein
MYLSVVLSFVVDFVCSCVWKLMEIVERAVAGG